MDDASMFDLDSLITIESEELLEYPRSGLPFQDMAVLVGESAMNAMQRHAASNLHAESGGLMLGHLHTSSNTTFVEITDVLPASSAEANFLSLKFDHQTWIDLDRRKRQYHLDKQTVGWYHSHLGIGVFFSPQDVTVHTLAFAEPWFVGMVVDPILGEQGVFRWSGNNIIQCPYHLQRTTLAASRHLLAVEVSERLEMLESFIGAKPAFRELASTLAQWQDSLRDSAQPEQPFYPKLLEISQMLALFAGTGRNSLKSVQAIIERLKRVLLLGAESLQPIAAGLPDEAPVSAVPGGIRALLAPQRMLLAGFKDEVQLTLLELPFPVSWLAAGSNATVMLTRSGEIAHLGYSFTEVTAPGQKIPATLLGRFRSEWWQEHGSGKLLTVCYHSNSLTLLTPESIWRTDLNENPSSLNPARFVDLRRHSTASDIALDNSGNAYLALSDAGVVRKLDASGRVQFEVTGDGERAFNNPASLVVHQGDLVVLDKSNYRLVFFDTRRGEYQRQYRFSSLLIVSKVRRVLSDGNDLFLQAGPNVFRVRNRPILQEPLRWSP